MMMKKLSILTIVAGLVSLNSYASSFSMSIVGAGDLSTLNVSNAPTSMTVNGVSVTNVSSSNKSKMGLGGGVLFDSMFSSAAGLEFGGLYITRKIETTTSFTALGVNSSTTSTDNTHFLQIPVLLRVYLNQALSIGAGGYIAEGLSGVDSDLKKSDYGLVASLGIHVPLGSSSAFLIDGRYNYGLKNVDNSSYGMTQKYRDVQFLAGLTFGFGGKH